jgi:hypothetical protein
LKHAREMKLALAVTALGLAGLIAWPYLRAAPGPADEFLMVCVASGEVFEMHVEDAPIIPAANPKTGTRTLIPCLRGEDGNLRVAQRYGVAIRGPLADVNQVVDAETLRVGARR